MFSEHVSNDLALHEIRRVLSPGY
ncbi:hypothetical protein [Chroococcidiopsis cubana]